MTKHDPARSDRVVSAIRGHTEAHGYPPSVREIGRMVGLASLAAVHHHLRALVKAGRLVETPGVARGYRLPPERNEAEDILFAVMLDRRVAELDPETQDRIGRYFTEHRRVAA